MNTPRFVVLVLCALALVIAGCIGAEPDYRFETAVRIEGGFDGSYEVEIDQRDYRPTKGLEAELLTLTPNETWFNIGSSLAEDEVPESYCFLADINIYEIGPPRTLVAFVPEGTCVDNNQNILATPVG